MNFYNRSDSSLFHQNDHLGVDLVLHLLKIEVKTDLVRKPLHISQIFNGINPLVDVKRMYMPMHMKLILTVVFYLEH